MSSEQVLSYHDSILYKSDISLIENNGWLNDHCILFWFQVLEYDKAVWTEAGEDGSNSVRDIIYERREELLFLQPAAAFTIQFLPTNELLAETEDNVFLKIKHKKLIFIPVVGNAGADSGGGSHWSLLVYHSNTIYHLDSSAGSNEYTARLVAERFSPLVSSSDPIKFEVLETAPQQGNSYDCGTFVLSNAEFIAAEYLKNGTLVFPNNDKHVLTKRLQMLRTIARLSK